MLVERYFLSSNRNNRLVEKGAKLVEKLKDDVGRKDRDVIEGKNIEVNRVICPKNKITMWKEWEDIFLEGLRICA